MEFNRIDEEHQKWFERPFTKDEVKAALNSLEDNKAPGLDGFPTRVLRVCWDVMGKEIMAALTAFHERDQWCRSLSVTFITLITKKMGASEVKDFRLISLVSCLYKLLSKTLALRLQSSFPKIMSKSQNAFVMGRQISDCSLLAKECVDVRMKEGTPGLIYKIDFEKAYDHVN